MVLSKEQIKYINNLLIEKSVKFWDVRLEMIDHIANDLEKKTEDSDLSFEKRVLNIMIYLGYNGNFKDTISAKQKEIQKQYFKIHKKEFVNFFKNYKLVLPYLIFCLLSFFFIENRLFLKISYLSSLMILGSFILFSLLNYNKVYKSIILLSSISGITFSISLFNLLLFTPWVYIFKYSPLPNWYLLSVTIIMIPIITSSLLVFYNTYKKYDFIPTTLV